MRPLALFLSVVALAISHAQAQSAMTCDDAMKYHEFAVDVSFAYLLPFSTCHGSGLKEFEAIYFQITR